MDLRAALIMAATAAIFAPHTFGYEFRARFSGRTGTKDPIADGMVYLPPGSSLRIRVQFGVFDDGGDPVPVGGFLGWTEGTIEQHGGIATRTPGRIAPFAFNDDPNANGYPPLPDGDPFTLLTQIDATLIPQTHTWGFDGDGVPLPMPQAVVRGFNAYISVFEFTLQIPDDATQNFTVNLGGNIRAATSWDIVGTPIPPDPETMTPGMVTYGAVPSEPAPIAAQLLVIVPAPGAAAGMLGGLLMMTRRRR